MGKIGIRREDKNKWERRTPIVPSDAKFLKEKYNIQTYIQPSKIRIFSDKEYEIGGAKVDEFLGNSSIIFGIKEIPLDFFEPKHTYVFFSHTIKGQKHNLPMLKRLIELGCQLIDYEKITDDSGRRLIFFGRYAGLAGAIDSLWALGKRLNYENVPNPFYKIKRAWEYKSLEEAKISIKNIGEEIKTDGIADEISPIVIGITGYGNVSKGVQEIVDLLPIKEISPNELISYSLNKNYIYKVVFKEEDMVECKSSDKFNLYDYYEHPDKYKSKFYKYLPYLTMLLNCIYWDDRYPRFVTKKYLHNIKKLKVIGDISCDINGSIECTMKYTTPDNPVFVYDTKEDKIIDGYEGNGIVILAIDNLPCEFPYESSIYFSSVLKKFIPSIALADYSVNFDKCNLPPEIKRATILYQGEFTPNYQYMKKFL